MRVRGRLRGYWFRRRALNLLREHRLRDLLLPTKLKLLQGLSPRSRADAHLYVIDCSFYQMHPSNGRDTHRTPTA